MAIVEQSQASTDGLHEFAHLRLDYDYERVLALGVLSMPQHGLSYVIKRKVMSCVYD